MNLGYTLISTHMYPGSKLKEKHASKCTAHLTLLFILELKIFSTRQKRYALERGNFTFWDSGPVKGCL